MSPRSEADAVGEAVVGVKEESSRHPTEVNVTPFSFDGVQGEVEEELFARAGSTGKNASDLGFGDLEQEVRRLTDPSAALETLHWGRNYLYRAALKAPGEAVDVAVKQFRYPGGLSGFLQRFKGTKAERSWRAALAFRRAGLPTPRPLLLVETSGKGPSFFVTKHLAGVIESREVFRAVEEGRREEAFPGLDYEGVLAELGRLLRRMHDAGIWHRDLSIGNVLLHGVHGVPDLSIIDLNRARTGKVPSVSERTRDLCRLRIFEEEHQRIFLDAYWGDGESPSGFKRWLYRRYHRGFLGKIETKKRVRGGLQSVGELFRIRRAHPHIPAAPEGAGARDKIVWDSLSDQPHQHASRLEKAAIRLADLGGHLRTAGALVTSLPRSLAHYRRLKAGLYARPTPFGLPGLGLRPCPEAPEALLTAVEDLGVGHLLLRLHPWQESHDEEEELARELHGRGYELAFALPQDRSLVKDPERWRTSLAQISERFRPFGRHFQVGQAINRSKWGIWNYREYAQLVAIAGDVLRTDDEVEILGPSVIDFEHHATAAVLNLGYEGLDFDIVSALLYVDRRGAPENEQAGFDTVDKVLLLKAIAEKSKNASGRCWVTEFNWPLWEGPHSPAGKDVSVDEESQASFLVRYLLLTLGCGAVERAYWWQMVARGYGLATVTPEGDLQRRPAFQALATAARLLKGTTVLERLPVEPPARFLRLARPEGGEIVVGWSTGEPVTARLPAPAAEVTSRDGEILPPPEGLEARLGPDPRYFLLEDA